MQLSRDPFNILVAGVGGQGNILASQIIATVATEAGFNVVVGETYGASQRGGAVTSHVRISAQRELGPLIPIGEADVILGLEPLESWRAATDYGNFETNLFVSLQRNYPLSVLQGEQQYPEDEKLLSDLKKLVGSVHTLQATDIARKAGDPKAQNMVMVGVLAGSGVLPVDLKLYEKVMTNALRGPFLEISLRAFRAGVQNQQAS